MKKNNWQILLLLGLSLSSCYQLDVHYQDTTEYPVAFGQHLAGFDILETRGHLSETLWVYHAGDLGQLPIGSREGLAHEDIWAHTFRKHLQAGEGIQYLKIRQQQTLATLLVRLLTLGLLSPTELNIEGKIVRVVPEGTRN